jgi:uncharacterized protein (TIGR00661 family)
MMRLLYGVQATGNGHISRARALQRALAPLHIQIDFLFSGRPAEQLFDMSAFGNYQWRRGLSFVSHAGKVCHWRTARQAYLRQLWQDIHQLETRRYDLVLTDFEPVTAWAARRQGTPLVAIGHQYAMEKPTPLCGMDLFSSLLLKNFAPARQSLGLHWHHFGHVQQHGRLVLPPIVDLPDYHAPANSAAEVLVYLPFEAAADVVQWLTPLRQFQFRIYGVGQPQHQLNHLTFCPPSVQAFKHDLISSSAVISNAGFELISEALQLNKRILVKPLLGQPEQRSNALALQQLGLASAQNELSTEIIRQFLQEYRAQQAVSYPNVAKTIADWLVEGNWYEHAALEKLWQQTVFQRQDIKPVDTVSAQQAAQMPTEIPQQSRA